MSKLFVVSDLHSFYTELKVALDKAGFDPNNENHWLIVCGDAFDRGEESEQMLHFLMSLDRKILISGNHDSLLEDCCKRGFALYHDISNGTAKTIFDIGGSGKINEFDKCCELAYAKMQAYRDNLVNYFETKNHIFVHGWIPCDMPGQRFKPWHQKCRLYEYNPNWRNSTAREWDNAKWVNGMDRALEGIIEPGKTIVCGHWHCSYGHSVKNSCSEFEADAIWEPFYTDGCIAIDRCTAHTKEVNVLILEDEFLEDFEYGKN